MPHSSTSLRKLISSTSTLRWRSSTSRWVTGPPASAANGKKQCHSTNADSISNTDSHPRKCRRGNRHDSQTSDKSDTEPSDSSDPITDSDTQPLPDSSHPLKSLSTEQLSCVARNLGSNQGSGLMTMAHQRLSEKFVVSFYLFISLNSYFAEGTQRNPNFIMDLKCLQALWAYTWYCKGHNRESGICLLPLW